MDNTIVLPPVLDDSKLDALGNRLFNIWDTHDNDRRAIEERWLRNLRQVRKIYDPEVKIPADRSKAYPGVTQWMVRGTIARLLQMLFPMTERNWGIKPSAMPDLSTEQIQQILDQLVVEKAQDGGPSQVVLADEDIEKAILAFAKGKAERMELKIEDDLQEMGYIDLIRKVVRSAVIYNIGVLKGPLHKIVKKRTWAKNQLTGKYEAKEVDGYKPMFEFLPVWNYYPDMTAVSLDKQDGTYERHIMTKAQIEELADRPDFLSDKIIKYLAEHPSGNWQAKHWEAAIKGEAKSAQATVSGKESRKYEVRSYWGGVTGAELSAAGLEVKDEDLGRTFHANAWVVDRTVIKCRLAPLGSEIKHHHVFVFEDDDLSILGNGQPDVLRDSQMSICESARAALDNMSVIGPMVEVNDDLVTPGQDLTIRKHMTIHREGEGQMANVPAVRNINIESHIGELMNMIQMFMRFAEQESGLPPPSVGDVSGGGSEALRTSKNASMFLGAAALPIRDTVRNFDVFTISVISALAAWNKKYDPNPTRDGDYETIARGSTSLIAKEVLSQALNEFRASITPDEMPHLKTRGMLVARMKANDLPLDELLEDEEKAQQTIERNAQTQQAAQQAQYELVLAQVKRELATALEREAKASSETTGIGVNVFKTLIDALSAGNKSTAASAKVLTEAGKADMMAAGQQGGQQ